LAAYAVPRMPAKGAFALRPQGCTWGRPPALNHTQRREALARREAGEGGLTDIARTFGVGHTTISRLRQSVVGLGVYRVATPALSR
jgi:hypothetical protein